MIRYKSRKFINLTDECMKVKGCKYCVEGPVIVMNYDKKEAKLYAAHLKHKHG